MNVTLLIIFIYLILNISERKNITKGQLRIKIETDLS